MKNEKRHHTIEEQVQLLLGRGLEGDPDLMASRLVVVNYYRLSGYWFPMQMGPSYPEIIGATPETFRPGSTFENVWRRYTFDRELRLLVLDAIERFEVAVRTQLAYHHAFIHGPFGYANDPKSRPKLKREDFAKFYAGLLEELGRSKEQCIKHYFKKYGDEHDVPPIWQAVEVMSFGNIVTLYRHTTSKVKQGVASTFGIPDTVMESWLLSLNTIRNICAHHSRLWNRELGNRPMIPRLEEFPDWHLPVQIRNERLFGILTILKYSMNRIAPQSQWALRFHKFLADYPDIPIADMGFPENWDQNPIWR
jgi:abortive infection bacteriophage resistance protein